jgi:branched-chain amino acid transport system substrate-binding protein
MARPAIARALATAVAAVVVGALAAGATAGRGPAGASTAPPDSEPATTTGSSVPSPRSDGILRIGVLLPQTGEGNWIGLPGIANAEYAVARINETGGFNDRDVELVVADEGDSPETAAAGIAELLAADVDAVVGPASSTVALATLDELMAAGILTCSPTASSLLLDRFPDRQLFFRTIPSDSLQMRAIAQQAQRSGVDSAVVVYLDDEFGRGLAEAVTGQLMRLEVDPVATIKVAADDEDLSGVIDELSQYAGSTIIVLADQGTGLRVLQAIAGSATLLSSDGELPALFVNDAVRPTVQQWAELEGPLLDSLERLGPVADMVPEPAVSDSTEPGGTAAGQPFGEVFALNTLDCVNLIALSAVEAGSDDPSEIAAWMRRTADAGRGCTTFTECRELLADNLDIDYEGGNPQNRLNWFAASTGDLGRAAVMTYRYDPALGYDRERGALQITMTE